MHLQIRTSFIEEKKNKNTITDKMIEKKEDCVNYLSNKKRNDLSLLFL